MSQDHFAKPTPRLPSTVASPVNSPFHEVSSQIDFPRDEATTLAFWKERRIFEKTVQARKGAPPFVFYEGPPTANGMPHNGHVLTRVVKDLFPRYKTMRGYEVPRKAGWDTHGLPVEVEVEKELRIHGKAAIERHGVEPFVVRCIESVFRYTAEWERLSDKIAFWADLKDAYVTYHRSYVESVWWALSNLFGKGLLYQGHKVVWWWAQGGTALSSAEVGLGYRVVDDPSAYVAFPLRDQPDTSLLVWTTTPWTLSSNMYAAVRPGVPYVTVSDGERKFIVADALRQPLAERLKKELTVVATHTAEDLVGLRYVPPFSTYEDEWKDTELERKVGDPVVACFRVIAADFVTLDTGTGIVHIAPAFGEDDHQAHARQLASYREPQLAPLLCAVDPDGTFRREMGKYAGQWVKAADKGILADLVATGRLVHSEIYRHDYPYCWRADQDPLIQYARPAWYIRTTAQIDRAIANNQQVQWLPDHIKNGRFGDFLANNVDWALSRERYWGTPLPLWIHSVTGEVEAISSLDELRRKPSSNLVEVEATLSAYDPKLAEHLLVHKPWIDQVTYRTEGAPGEWRRVPEVIDCWFDSGCMPFAQWGFPHQDGSFEQFRRAFPADFISEAIDQTRGWFYSLLMVSTLVFDDATLQSLGLPPREPPYPYKTCIVMGHVSDKEGKKESKSKGNYTPPEVILEKVRMDFAIVPEKSVKVTAETGVALIAREDLEGLDLTEGSSVRVYRSDRAASGIDLKVRAGKGMPRRVVVLSDAESLQLDVAPGAKGADVQPVEVPRLLNEHRVTVEDLSSPAPGADAFRWFFCAASPPWTNTRHSLANVRALQKELPLKLRNVYSFFTIYARIDGWSPAPGNESAHGPIHQALQGSPGYRKVAERSLLDRWILSELALSVRKLTEHLDGYRMYEGAEVLASLTEALSNWYVRRSRERFWVAGLPQDKVDAYFTLYEVLTTIAELAAPFIPFLAEELYQNLVRGPWPTSQEESVHLRFFPEPAQEDIERALAEEMQIVRELVSLGLQVRTASRLKVRQPLAFIEILLARQELNGRIEQHAALIAEELNVQRVSFLRTGEEGAKVRYKLKPNFRALGPKLGKRVQLAKKVLESANAAELRAELLATGHATIHIEGEAIALDPAEIEITVEAVPGYAAAGDGVGVVVLHTELTPELLDAGLVREVLSRIQAFRKDIGLGFADRIDLTIDGSERVLRVCGEARQLIARDTLAQLQVGGVAPSGADVRELSLDAESLTLAIARRS